MKVASGFQDYRKVQHGIREIKEIVRLGIIQNPEDQKYYNVPHKA